MTQNLKLLIISETPALVNKTKRSDITETHDILMCVRQHKTIFELDAAKSAENDGETADVWAFDVKNLYFRDTKRLYIGF